MTRGKEAADSASLIAEGTQIDAAFRLYFSDGQGAALTIEGLPGKPYLAASPAGWGATCSPSVCLIQKALPIAAETTCSALNRQAGLAAISNVTVYDLVTAPFFCSPLMDENGAPSGFQFTFMHRR